MKNNIFTGLINSFKNATTFKKIIYIIVAVICLSQVYLIYSMVVYLTTWLAQPRFTNGEVVSSSLGFLVQFFIFIGIFLATCGANIALIVVFLKKSVNGDIANNGWQIVKIEADLNECYALRLRVFADEQGFDPALDIDDIDSFATHIMKKIDGKVVATARVFEQNGDHVIGRICIEKEFRKCGYGREVMLYGKNIIIKNGGNRIVLSAQYHAYPFYEKCGYTCVGEIYLDEGKDHIKMIKNL